MSRDPQQVAGHLDRKHAPALVGFERWHAGGITNKHAATKLVGVSTLILRKHQQGLRPTILLPSIQVARNKIHEKLRHLFWLNDYLKIYDSSKRNSRPQL